VIGVGGIIYILFFASGWRGSVVVAAATVGFVGLYWLWADFIADPQPDD